MNKTNWYRTVVLLLLLFSGISLFAQKKFNVSGQISDKDQGTNLPYATVIADDSIGVTTDENGKFSVKLTPGNHKLKVTFLGYSHQTMFLNVKADTNLKMEMFAEVNQLEEFVIEDEAFYGEKKLESSQMSTVSLNPKEIKMIPSLAGEADVIKVAQLLPGVSKGVEGSTDYFVRGGDADQNLVLLDGATVYNTGHLFGFMSVFNPDAIGDVTMMNGAFPAHYGGRLSSILDIKTDHEVPDKTNVKGSIGLISSRLTIKKPMKQQKMSFMLSGRRTYIDQILAKANTEVQLPYYFYDLNGRLNFNPNPKNKFYLSGYFGADILDFSRSSRRNNGSFKSNFNIKNNSQSFGWKHIYSKNKFSDFSVSRTFYAYNINNSFEDNGIDLSSSLEDYSARFKMENYRADSSRITWGGSFITHAISPSILNSRGIVATIISSNRSRSLNAYEGAIFGQYEKDLTIRLKATVGYRQSFAISDGKFYTGYEPRLAFRYKLNEFSSLKASYSRMSQYMHRVSSSAVSLPTDVWYTVTKRIKPQSSDQFVLGYVRTLPKANIFFSSEVYYKQMNNLTEYQEGTNLVLNTDFEKHLIQGKGDSYGIELLVRREHARLQGWVSYTLSWTNRHFPDLNGGRVFPAKYDRRHNVSIVGMYDITKRLTFSAVWEYISGSKFTPVIGQYAVLNPAYSGIELIPVYSDRNAVGLSDAHRLDIGLILKSKERKRFKSEWHFGIYNVYNRATPVSLIVSNENGQYKYVQPGLFGLIPSISYNFEF